MKTALLTGSSGFLARHIAPELVARGWRVVGVDRRPLGVNEIRAMGLSEARVLALPAASLRSLLFDVQPDLLIHAAGPSSVPKSMTDPAGDFHDSAAAVFDLLDALRRTRPACRVVYLSSAAVYGNPKDLPVRETAGERPVSAYGFHKLICEQLLREFVTVYGLHACAVRVFSAYGAGLRRQVLWDIARRALTDGGVELSGTGQESRDFVHARDVAQGVVVVGENARFESETYNLGSGNETRISDLADLLLCELGCRFRASFSGAARCGDPLRWRADNRSIMSLGYSPLVSLEEGVAEYAGWVRHTLAAVPVRPTPTAPTEFARPPRELIVQPVA